jgi:hypothetical protein
MYRKRYYKRKPRNAVALTDVNGTIQEIILDKEVADAAERYAVNRGDINLKNFHRYRVKMLIKRGMLAWAEKAGCVAHVSYSETSESRVNQWIYYNKNPNVNDCRTAIEDWLMADCGSYHFEQVIKELEKEELRNARANVHLTSIGRTLQMAVAVREEELADREEQFEAQREEEKDYAEQLVDAITT